MNTPASNDASMTMTKTTIGTSFATVTMRFTAVAWRTPRAMSRWHTQMHAEAPATARTVLPSPRPGRNAPSAAIANVRKKTLPTTLLAQ